MAGYSPVSLPSLSTLFDPPGSLGSAGSPAPLPSLGLMLGNTGGRAPLTAAAGSFALSGVSTPLKVGRKVAPAAGAFALTGQDATLTKPGVNSVAAPASLPHLGLVLELASGIKFMTAAVGSFAWSGVAAGLNRGHALIADVGVFVVSGAPALRDLQVTADRATFAITRNDATLRRTAGAFTAGAGSFAFTGRAAALVYETATARTLAGESGTFLMTGQGATLPATILRKLVADTGSFAFTGKAATFIAVHWSPIVPTGDIWTNVTGPATTWDNA